MFQALHWEETPPDVVVQVGSISPAAAGYLVQFRAINHGGQTAEGLVVRGELRGDDNIIETSETQIDYVPADSERRGGLYFRIDPRQVQLEIRALGYELLGIGFIEISAIAGAVEIVVGVLRTRAPGMSLDKMPIYCWAMLVFAGMIIFAFPAVILGTALLELERSFKWPFFIADKGGDPLLWQHLFWFFGHPMVVLILVSVSIFASLVFAYFFLWTVSPEIWPVGEEKLPAFRYPLVAALLLAGSSAASPIGANMRVRQQNTVTSPSMAPFSKSGVRVLYSPRGPESYSINYRGRKVYRAADEGLGPWRGLQSTMP